MSGHLVIGVAELADGSFTVVLALGGESIELADETVLATAVALGAALADCRIRRRGHAITNGDPIRWRHEQEDPDE